MVIQTEQITAEAFDEFISLPENADRAFELIGGRIVEVVSNNNSSFIAMTIAIHIGMFVIQRKLGRITGADGGYIVMGEKYIPDVAYISLARQPEPSHEAYNPIPPDLAVEVLSPTNNPADMRIKVVNYLRANVTIWVVDSDKNRLKSMYLDKHPKRLA